jgi:hypothetical protein
MLSEALRRKRRMYKRHPNTPARFFAGYLFYEAHGAIKHTTPKRPGMYVRPEVLAAVRQQVKEDGRPWLDIYEAMTDKECQAFVKKHSSPVA